MSVATGIIKVLRRKLAELGPCELKALEVSIGDHSGIAPESLRLALETLLTEAGYTGVEIRFESVPAEFECQACCFWKGREETVICPLCGEGAVFIVAGQDVTLERIEVE